MLGLARLNQDGGDGDVCSRILVLAQHQIVVHLVDMIAGKNQDVPWLLRTDGVDV